MKKNVWEKLQEKAEEANESWRIEKIWPFILLPLCSFINNYEDRSPKDILDHIAAMRACVSGDYLLSPGLRGKIDNEFDSHETNIREGVLLAIGVANKELWPDMASYIKVAVDEKSNYTVLRFDRANTGVFVKARLEHLREMSEKKGLIFQEVIKKPLGKQLTRNLNKSAPSHKNWPVVKRAIVDLYRLLLPLYKTKNRRYTSRRRGGSQDDAHALYPQELLRDICELVRQDIPLLADLNMRDIKSRIQYESESGKLEAYTFEELCIER